MKNIILFICLIVTINTTAQTKDCNIDYEIKNDTTDFKKIMEYLFVEKSYPNSIESVYLSLIKSDGLSLIQLQYLQKDSNFISASCVDQKSMITFQLLNGTIVNFRHANTDYCNNLSYDPEQKANIRILSTYFQIQKDDFKRLKESPISVMQIRFQNSTKTFEVESKIESKVVQETYSPNTYFMQNLHCIE